jgi:hypothetical protein
VTSNVEITVPVAAFVSTITRAADGSVTRARSAAQKAVERHSEAMRKSFRGYSGTKGDALQARTGTLRRAIGFSKDPNAPSSFVAGAKYARLQEHGGVVKPTGGRQYLTIPLKAALMPGGAFRPAARLVNRGAGWHTAGRVPGGAADTQTFIAKGVIFGKGANGRPLALYALKRSVKVPPRLRFFATWQGQEAAREADYAKALDDATREAVR